MLNLNSGQVTVSTIVSVWLSKFCYILYEVFILLCKDSPHFGLQGLKKVVDKYLVYNQLTFYFNEVGQVGGYFTSAVEVPEGCGCGCRCTYRVRFCKKIGFQIKRKKKYTQVPRYRISSLNLLNNFEKMFVCQSACSEHLNERPNCNTPRLKL